MHLCVPTPNIETKIQRKKNSTKEIKLAEYKDIILMQQKYLNSKLLNLMTHHCRREAKTPINNPDGEQRNNS